MSERSLYIVIGILAAACLILVFNDSAGQSFGIENNTFASLAYLGVLGGVIGATVLRRGLPTGNLIRSAGIWLALFLAMMVVYQLLAQADMLPANFRPRIVVPDSGTGVTASLVDGVDRVLHL